MSSLKSALVLLASCAGCLAQADFRFHLFDETRNSSLLLDQEQDIKLIDFDSQLPRLIYRKDYRIRGVNQHKFTFTTENYAGDISRENFKKAMEAVKDLSREGLEAPAGSPAGESSYGWVTLDGKDIDVTATPDKDVRKKWQFFLDSLLAAQAPVEKREIRQRTIEGETVEPRDVDFTTLMNYPEKYDGKRIRITGFYHGESEDSSFAASREDVGNTGKSVWLGGPSAFADLRRVPDLNDTMLTVEGTYQHGKSGHEGLWPGEIVRLTEALPPASPEGGRDARVEITVMAICNRSGGKLETGSTGCAVLRVANRSAETIDFPTGSRSLGKGRSQAWKELSYLSPERDKDQLHIACEMPLVTVEFLSREWKVVHRDASIQLPRMAPLEAGKKMEYPILFSTPDMPGIYGFRFSFDNTPMGQPDGNNIDAILGGPPPPLVTMKRVVEIPEVPVEASEQK